MTQLLDSSPRTDISQFADKDAVLRVIEHEYRGVVAMLLAATDEEWQAPTPCAEWELRDLAGHLLDVAGGYLGYFRMAREGYPAEPPRGMRVYADQLGEQARGYRDLSRHELIARLQAYTDELYRQFHALDEPGWSSLIPHKWAGPVPAFMMPAFQLMDYTVHTWDVQRSLGLPTQLTPEAADILVPFLLGLKGFCLDDEAKAIDGSLAEVDLEIQLDIAGRTGDTWTVTVKDGAYGFVPGASPGAQAVVRYENAAEFALDAYQRFAGGQASGDPRAITQFRNLFFTI